VATFRFTDRAVNELSSLVGEELNAVCFVTDYVEFHFNGPVVRSLSSPRIETPAGTLEFPAAGSRDACCALIGREVSDVVLVEGVSLTLRFVSEPRATPGDRPRAHRRRGQHRPPSMETRCGASSRGDREPSRPVATFEASPRLRSRSVGRRWERPENRISVPKVFRTEDAARHEAERLNTVNHDKGCRYFVVVSRLSNDVVR
jgi:hypothetical protein